MLARPFPPRRVVHLPGAGDRAHERYRDARTLPGCTSCRHSFWFWQHIPDSSCPLLKVHDYRVSDASRSDPAETRWNQILQVSDDGTQNLLPLQIFLPPNLPGGTALTLSTSEPDDVDIWDTPNPSSGDAPLFGGGGADSISWTSGSGTIPSTLYVGAIQPSQAAGGLTFTLSALLPGAAGPTSQPTSTTSPATAYSVDIVGTFGTTNNQVITGKRQQPVIVGEGIQLFASVQPAGLNPSFSWIVPGD
jgi:hypothetical protein